MSIFVCGKNNNSLTDLQPLPTPSIVVLSTSATNNMTASSSPAAKNNLVLSPIDHNNKMPLGKKKSVLDELKKIDSVTSGSGEENILKTSTPSQTNKRMQHQPDSIEIPDGDDEQKDFNKNLNAADKNVKTNSEKEASGGGGISKCLYKDFAMKNFESMDEDVKESFSSSNETSSISNSRQKINDTNNDKDELSFNLNSQEVNDLYEKIISLIFKLMWDGISGSNEEAWKERCQVFSSISRLSKEFVMIKPIEFIEIHLVEMCLQRLISDSKKITSSKDQLIFMENSRELVKLIDYFISKSQKISEKLVSMTITLFDQMRAFDHPKYTGFGSSSSSKNKDSSTTSTSDYHSTSTTSSNRKISLSSYGNLNSSNSNNNNTMVSQALLNSYGIIHDEWNETSYLGMNILLSVLASNDLEICAQTSAKINTILHNRHIQNYEEACYLIANIDRIIEEKLKVNENGDDHFYAFVIPIMKCLIEKCYTLLQMNVQVPNIPFSQMSPTFFDDFKTYCKTDEWRIFIQKQVLPFREQYMAMIVNPIQMNTKIWWNNCLELLMVSIHKRNRVLGESKIKFEDSIFNSWKEREKQETNRYQNYLLQIKRNDLTMRKQLHSTLRFFNSERGSWYEGKKETYWMLSNHETRDRMRCKLIENLQFDSHFEASRLRDYSNYSSYMQPPHDDDENTSLTSEIKAIEENTESNKLAKNLQQNKEAINTEINEDIVDVVMEDQLNNNPNSQQHHLQPNSTKTDTNSNSSLTNNSMSRISSTSSALNTSTTNNKTPVSSQKSIQSIQQPQQEHYNEVIFSQFDEKEKPIVKSECELVTVTRIIKGRFELTNKYIYFFDTFSSFYCEQSESFNYFNNDESNEHNHNNNNQNNQNNNGSFSSGFNCHDFDILNDFKLPLSQLKDVQLRRYNLRRSSLEFFLINESNFFLNFSKNEIRNKIYRKITSMKLPNLISNPSVRTQAELLKVSDYTQKWCNHEMSNFEYLMKLNTIAGRSYNDLSQYPVFPWILKDYTSETLNINDPNVYRDLSKPVGVLNKKNEDYVRQKYELFEDPTGAMKPFHYGTHYSNSANVMHYLVRLEPFTTLHIQLQSDRFDLADRQFHSIASTWRILYESPSDVKELIPEFFYLSEFLENMNNFDFGELQVSKNKVDNVTLPKWAKSPEHFIYLHRKALESDFVSEHLHEWIDLIFGYKQQGPEAEKALNVFMYCSYEGAIDLDAITDPVARRATEGMISNFGQTPTQLLKEPHAKRKSKEQSIRDKILNGQPIILWHQINKLKAYYIELCEQKKDSEYLDSVIYISIPRNQAKSFMQQGLVDPLISITISGVIGVNGWQAHEKSLTNLFSFEKDPSLLNDKTKKSVAGPFNPNIEIDARIFVLSHDSKLLISGGHWDNSLRVFSLSKYRNIAQIYQHSNIVTCLAIDYTGTLLVSGSKDCTCIVWQIVHENGNSVNLDPVPIHILYGHNAPITSVDISNELDTIVSASLDGTVNFYSILKGYYIRTISFAQDERISKFFNINVKLSNHRFILIYVNGMSNDILNRKNVYELYLYSINGKFISKEYLNYPVQDMIIKDDYCILGLQIINSRQLTPNSSLNISGLSDKSSQNEYLASTPSNVKYHNSKIVFKECFDLKTVHTMRLKAPITCMFLTREDSHLLVGLKDGKLIVITGERQLK